MNNILRLLKVSQMRVRRRCGPLAFMGPGPPSADLMEYDITLITK